jgi:hypothetical protein
MPVARFPPAGFSSNPAALRLEEAAGPPLIGKAPMHALITMVLVLAGLPEAPDSARTTVPADTLSAGRVVRTLAPVEVHAVLPDRLSSQTPHPLSQASLRDYPVNRLAKALALQAGVVAQAEEL